MGKQVPRQQRRKNKDRRGNAVGWDLRNSAEDDGEYDHRDQRLEHDPPDTDQGLAITYLKVSPYQKVEQLSVFHTALRSRAKRLFRG
jgi:hypothetical protein